MKSPEDKSYMFKPNLMIWEPNVNESCDESEFEQTYGLDMKLYNRTDYCPMPMLVADSIDNITF